MPSIDPTNDPLAALADLPDAPGPLRRTMDRKARGEVAVESPGPS